MVLAKKPSLEVVAELVNSFEFHTDLISDCESFLNSFKHGNFPITHARCCEQSFSMTNEVAITSAKLQIKESKKLLKNINKQLNVARYSIERFNLQ